ncbi:MAG: glucose-1-phosphate adenylyltransferase [Thermodesulfobacteriota bacterium]|nr:glucose-1-phosphate adenylyltransferase [Thermodesulfobacteriota bacterium]
MPRNTNVIILAGGKGQRLYPLTKNRSKPAVPFGGMYRIIDFTLSNCVNSGLKHVYILSQYKSNSLNRHILQGWTPFFSYPLGEFIYNMPPQQRIGNNWYEGTADAVFQNIYTLQKDMSEYTMILSGDHIYQMNYLEMMDYHKEQEADVTIGTVAMPVETASQFGIIQVDERMEVKAFQEKPLHAPLTLPNDPGRVLVSMGIYIFRTTALMDALIDDARKKTSSHDFGKDIIPKMLKDAKIMAFGFQGIRDNEYWRDIGTLDAYYAANMDLVSVSPKCHLYDKTWPIHTVYNPYPPAKMIFSGGEDGRRIGTALDSIVCGGTIISGARVERSIISPNCRVNSYALIKDSILFEDVVVGRNCTIKNAIIDKRVHIPEGTSIGLDRQKDAHRFDISPKGIVVVPESTVFE